MRQLILLIIICTLFSALTSCNKVEEVKVEKLSTSQGDETLGDAMKRASRDLRRLSSSVEGRDWVEIEMWTKELKEGIGYSCVELYMAEHRGISSEFVILGSQFYDAVRKLTESCKEHDVEAIDSKFDRLIKTCDDCHDIYKEKEGLPLMLQH
ncbi:cytochrome c [Candidatus Scalindua japonica]|uniref:Cytochrome c n=1 Tax=Candidatus Scalindua japonica TaxID=1284222 RepID=A0A286U2W4_9BACT|nr:cytochrome c [Candidatus Scalindua japonica]GAX62476.1 cytochrome c [Candidatus Scalindua japonica]